MGPPIIASRPDAINEADRTNFTNQAVIVAKEGAAKVISNLVVNDITVGVLRSPDGKDYNGMDDYTFNDVMAATIAGADRKATADVLNQLLEIHNFAFGFRKKGQCKCRAPQSKSRLDGHLQH